MNEIENAKMAQSYDEKKKNENSLMQTYHQTTFITFVRDQKNNKQNLSKWKNKEGHFLNYSCGEKNYTSQYNFINLFTILKISIYLPLNFMTKIITND